MVEVVATDEFTAWYLGLEESDRKIVARVIDLLELKGVALEFPHSSNINGSEFALRELRPLKGASPLRVFYAFDPARNAVVLAAGSKAEGGDFYDRMIKASTKIWDAYLVETNQRKK